MSQELREVIERQQAVYEVSRHYVVYEDRSVKTTPNLRRIQAGFDIDVYTINGSHPPGSSPEYALVYAALQNVAHSVMPHTTDCCDLEVIPFGSSVFPDTKRKLQPRAMLRIRINHGRGLDRPSGASEDRALKEVQQELHDLGVKPGR